MRAFFYFVPDKHALTRAAAAELGLAYAFERGIDCAQVERGPGGKRGVVVAQQDSYADGQLGYYEHRQVWRPIGGTPLYVGHFRDAVPGPEDLARQTQLAGPRLELADGRSWQVPLARAYSERAVGEEIELRWSVQLPQQLELAADGRWVTGNVNRRYAALWELAEAWLRLRTGTETAEDRERLDFQGQTDGAVLALQANYRLGRVEAALLGLLTDCGVIEVLDRLVDLPTLTEFTKKKQMRLAAEAATSAAGCSSSAGPADATPITGPPSPT